MVKLSIRSAPPVLQGDILLPPSKSIYHRLLLINELGQLELDIQPQALANDTLLMQQVLSSHLPTWDLQDAGTPLRLLTARAALLTQETYITGTARMQERPVGALADALTSLGAQFRWERRAGYPPFYIQGGKLASAPLYINASVSSQFISALMLIGPYLSNGLNLTLQGTVASAPYIALTTALMQRFGAQVTFTHQHIQVLPGTYSAQAKQVMVESDWSAASYWAAFALLAKQSRIMIGHLHARSLQGDHSIIQWLAPFGLNAEYQASGLVLTKQAILKPTHTPIFQLRDYPDIAPTLVVLMAALQQDAVFEGLENLRIKESDRTAILAQHLQQAGIHFYEDRQVWKLDCAQTQWPSTLVVNPHDDHRMAMALALLSYKTQVHIYQADCVHKSYPGFFEDMKALGFSIQQQ